MINEELFKKISAKIDSYRQDMINLQIDLCAIPAVGPDNGGDGEKLKADFLKKKLLELGFNNFQHYDAHDERVSSKTRPNFLTTIEGRNQKKFVWIITHLDVVPPGDLNLWSRDPYKACVKDGHIFGRGVEDNQQDMVASIFAARAVMEEGILSEKSIGLGFVADEETSGKMGLYHLMSANEKLFGYDDLIVIPDFGNTDGSLIEIAEKSILWLSFRTKGKQCHASMPQLGINAFVAASELVTKLSRLKKIFFRSDPLFNPETSTFEPTRKETNVGNINTIPGNDVFYVDCRILPEYDLNDVIHAIKHITSKIEKKYKVSIEISPVQYFQAPPSTPATSPVVISLKEAIFDIYGIKAFTGGVGGGTLASYFRVKNIPAAVWSKSCNNAHQPDEKCSIDDMIKNAKVFAHLFLQN